MAVWFYKTCPSCAAEVITSTIVCPHCGHELPHSSIWRKPGGHGAGVAASVVVTLLLLGLALAGRCGPTAGAHSETRLADGHADR